MVKSQEKSQQQINYDSQSQKYQPALNQRYQSSEQQSSEQQSRQKQFQSEQNQKHDQQNSNQVHQRINKLQKQQDRIKNQLKELPYGLILRQKQQLQKQRNDMMSKKKLGNKRKMIKKQQEATQPKDKNAPKQLPIHKKPPKKIVTIFEPQRPKSIDPRFQDYAGSYNQDLAMKSFDFIPKIQQQQIKALRSTLDQSKKGNKKNSRRNKKQLTQPQKKRLIGEYNKLTNQKRQVELGEIEKEVKRSIREKNEKNYEDNNNYREKSNFSANKYNNDRQNNRPPVNYIPKQVFKQQFQKVKQARMSDGDRKQYLKDKQKKLFRNQQVQRNNLMYQTAGRFVFNKKK